MLQLDHLSVVVFLRWIESTVFDIGDTMQKSARSMFSRSELGLHLLWRLIHLIVAIWYFMLRLIDAVEDFLITHGFIKKYKTLDISKVKYLAVVIDSDEALQILKVLDLLRWLAAIGLRNVCLYDPEGVLKKSKEAIMLRLQTMSKGTSSDPYMNLEFISFSDGKEAVAKAANYLFDKKYSGANIEKRDLTEPEMGDALKAIGYGAPEPDLMLIYGPVRCHLGFPAWRIRYTEIVHMGSLNHMKFGILRKAIHRFTTVHQNYGT